MAAANPRVLAAAVNKATGYLRDTLKASIDLYLTLPHLKEQCLQ
jgi:hypothetical protein